MISQSLSGEDPLLSLEHNLAVTLKPILPDPDFVKRLGHRILNPSPITLERRTGLKAMIIFSLALFSGILLLWLLIHLFRFLSGRD